MRHRRACRTASTQGKLDQFELSDIVRNLVSRRPAGVAGSFERRERITMRNNARAAAAIGIGYMMGRNHRFRGALVLAAATAVGGSPIGSRLLKRGIRMVASPDMLGKVSPQLGDIADTMRNDLLTAGKAAASAAFSNRVDSLADSIHERAERVRNPVDMLSPDSDEAEDVEAKASDGATRVAGRATRAAGRATRVADQDASEPDDTDEPVDDEPGEDEPGEDDGEVRGESDGEPRGESDEDETPLRRMGARRRSPVSRAQDSQTQSSRARSSQGRSSQARSSQTQGSATRSTRSQANRTGR
jgi:hypothetical protein